MNRTILGAVLVLALMIMVSATTVSVMTVKPAKPVSTMSAYDDAEVVNNKILQYSKQGYIVKDLTFDSGRRYAMVVMEKY